VPLLQQDLQPLHQEAEFGRGFVGTVRQQTRREAELAEFKGGRRRDELHCLRMDLRQDLFKGGAVHRLFNK